ncbi:hypothetical protein E2562_003991 [Oryza meyeriana var. granulata]|uniref:TMEM205-like domain-containing protein n=1 Tax=Oryza meyeriana var. granulata TaxID=110450 RepID=A0A6G1BI72_9ORYZ|nr:hypothetical protein E2562_003991 [Oryza meyeriana var. granulata]
MHMHAAQWSEMLQLLLLAVFLLAGAGAGALSLSSPAGATTTTAVKAAHLLCFATSWGVIVWAILVGGVIMFLNLPRHMMGSLRGKVFPACFALNAACTAAAAAAFAWLHRPWLAAAPPAECRQLAVLLAAAGFDLANLLVFTPRTLERPEASPVYPLKITYI